MKAKDPFYFYTSSQLVGITGKKAANIKEFLEIFKNIDDSSIFYHIHQAFREYQFAPGVYGNDFAHWVKDELNENTLAKRLANIKINNYTNINSLREKIVNIIEDYIKIYPESGNKLAAHKFYFCKNIGFIQKTKYAAWDLQEFCENLNKVGLRSLFFHFFEARLRLGRNSNDFSNWIKHNFGDESLARQIESLDPYLYTMDQLRDKIISMINKGKENFFVKLLKWLKIK